MYKPITQTNKIRKILNEILVNKIQEYINWMYNHEDDFIMIYIISFQE